MSRSHFGIEKVSPRKRKIYEVIFESDTTGGRLFDIILLLLILASVILVMMESVDFIKKDNESFFRILEWIITALFSLEYAIRIYCVGRPWRYIRSFYGIIDLLAVLPTFIALILPFAQSLIIIRSLRLLRAFRILNIEPFRQESQSLIVALTKSSAKIFVFLFAVLLVVSIFGTLIYIIEPPESGFSSIPKSVYWAIVTVTTVGYGDLIPLTAWGQLVATILMIMGYGVIAVPTGIVSSEMARQDNTGKPLPKPDFKLFQCPKCGAADHLKSAKYCHSCSHTLQTRDSD